jgi:deoxycytidine triphosphate deaminase
MYLTDREIRARLSELAIETDSSVAFNADDQIQPCSIDLHMSPVYWRPRRPLTGLFWRRRNFTLDLTGSRLLEISPRRHWSQHTLVPGETVPLRPGQLILGRIYEKLTIPTDCAGQLEGRSSFARMGRTVHATGSFINPGWRGHMPLTLVNHGRFVLRLPPYLPVCQLMLVKLPQAPHRLYGSEELQSKYVNDDGGPSYWWRDKMMARLLEIMGRTAAGVEMQERLLERIGAPPDDVLERLERLVDSQAYTSFGNVDELLLIFAQREDRQRMLDRIFVGAAKAAFPIMLALSLGSFFEKPVGFLHYAVWLVTLITLPITVAAFRNSAGDYLGRKELRELERMRTGSPRTS